MGKTDLITTCFLGFLALKILIVIYLDLRNRSYILKHKTAVPEKFKDKITLDEHQKAASYSATKINTGFLFLVINTIILLAWTLGGGLSILDSFVRGFVSGPIKTGVLFFIAFSAVSMILNLPQILYSTFVIEEKYGFNKTTPKTFILDMLKGILLSSIIGIPIAFAILWIMKVLGNFWWIYAWAFLTLVQIIMIIVYPIFIAPIFNKFTPMEEGEVKDKILGLLDKTDFSAKGLFVMDASRRSAHGNAYFTGLGKSKRIVFFDTIIEKLNANQIVAVLAHELGHFRKKHIHKNLMIGILMSGIGFAILGYLYKLPAFYQALGVSTPSAYMALILFSMVAPIFTFLLTPISAWFSRRHEFEADKFATTYADGTDLISALVQLHRDNASTLTPDPLYSAFYYSHPSVLDRVNYLESQMN